MIQVHGLNTLDLYGQMLVRASMGAMAQRDFQDGVVAQIDRLDCLDAKVLAPLSRVVSHLEPYQNWFPGIPMHYFWRTTNMTFPQELYARSGHSFERLKEDPLFLKKFSYTGRMMMGGERKDIDLIDWFVRRMKSKWARCPFYWLPTFSTDLAYREAKTGKFLLQRGAAVGGFCLAGLFMYPLKNRQIQSTLFIRNWGARRWLANLNGMAYLLKAFQEHLPQWDFFGNGFKVMASMGQIDWPTAILRALHDKVKKIHLSS